MERNRRIARETHQATGTVFTIQPTWTLLLFTLVESILGDGVVSGVHAIIQTRFCDPKSSWKGLTVGKAFATARSHNTSAIELWQSGTDMPLPFVSETFSFAQSALE